MDGPLSHREASPRANCLIMSLRRLKLTLQKVLHGQNALAVMPTGSGKSLCFQIPALVLGGLTIVVSPLVALMRNQVDALRLLGVGAECISSGSTRSENVAAWRRTTAGETRLLYMAPERLMTELMLAALNDLPIRPEKSI